MSMQREGDGGLDPAMVRIRQRLRALRSRYAGTALTTELTHIHDDQVVVRAALSLPDGSAVTAYAAEPIDETGMLDGALELAEQRATARALDLLGVGDFGGDTRRAPARPEPAEQPAPLASTAEDAAADDDEADGVVEMPDMPEPPHPAAEENEEEPEAETPAAAPAPARDDEPDMADYTWTHLWSWARSHGVTDRAAVDQRVGRPTVGLSPREIRELLIEAGLPA